jgi:hypothetical protein
MLTFFALAQARHQDLQREVAELRRLAAARTVDRTPLERPASERCARTLSSLKTLSNLKTRPGLKGDRPCQNALHPC